MSRLNTPIPLPPKPGIVSLCEMAIAAGTAGLSIAVYFQEFPPHLLCKLWVYCMNFAGPIEVRQVRNQGDIFACPATSTKTVSNDNVRPLSLRCLHIARSFPSSLRVEIWAGMCRHHLDWLRPEHLALQWLLAKITAPAQEDAA